MRATIDAPHGAEENGVTLTVSPLPHHTTCQLCPWVSWHWKDGQEQGPMVQLLAHAAEMHPCTCKTRSIVRKVGQRGHRELHTLTLVCETHRAVRCPECGAVLVNRMCPRCDAEMVS